MKDWNDLTVEELHKVIEKGHKDFRRYINCYQCNQLSIYDNPDVFKILAAIELFKEKNNEA
jgi:hypothetical protein